MKTRSSHHLLSALLVVAVALVAATSARAQVNVKWLRQFGTSTSDLGEGIAVDALGQTWIAGASTLGSASAGGYDFYLARLSPTGTLDFTRSRGGISTDVAQGVALVGGSVFAGGYSYSGSIDGSNSLGGNDDGLLVRYDTSGTWQATTRVGGLSDDEISDLAGNATDLLVAGSTYSSFEGQTVPGGHTAFLSKRTAIGVVEWTRFTASGVNSFGKSAAFDSLGNAYLAGSSTNFPDDVFVSRYDAAGNLTLFKLFSAGEALGVVADITGNIYLTGKTSVGLGGQINAGGNDAFVMKLDSNGNVLWTRLMGGSGDEVATGIGLDLAGHVWIGGASNSTFGGHTNAGGYDGFVAMYSTAGSLLGTTFLATTGDDYVEALTTSIDPAAYVTGYTRGALGGPNAGAFDAFAAKIVPEPSAALLLAGAGAGLLLRRRRA